ncbi:MAG: hypothetical protein CMJ78_11450, partial [Planctomycetaceae bacterium]|nr:hypothetical protein [Planctomycetaceae bacterium]
DDDVITGGIVFNGGGDNDNDSVGAGNGDSLLELRTTGGSDIRLNGPVTLASDLLITTNGDGGLDTGQGTAGNITLTHDAPVNSQATENNDLELRSGTGTVNINANLGDGAIGTTRALESVVISDTTGLVTFGGTDTITAAQDAGPVTLVRTVAEINLGKGTEDDDEISGSVILNGGNSGLIEVRTIAGGTVRINGPLTIQTDVRIDTDPTANTSTGGADVTFTNQASIDSQASEANDLVIDVGVASVFFNEDIGTAADGELGRLEVEGSDATSVVFGQADVESAADTGPVNRIELVGGGTTANALDIGSLDVVGRVVFNGGAANTIIETTTDAVRINGPVILESDLRIDTDVAAAAGTEVGNVLFTNDASIDSDANEANDLVIDAGSAGVFFNEDIGSTANGQLGRLEIEQAVTSVVFGQADTEAALDTGPVNLVSVVGDETAGNAIDIGSIDIIGSIVLNGGTVNSANDVVAIQSTTDAMRFNGPITLRSDVRIDTSIAAASGTEVGNVLFTNDAPIDSDLTEANDLVIDVAAASVFFNEDIGAATANSELGRLEIENADTSVVFGQADDESGADIGPVNTVNLVGDGSNGNALDIGSVTSTGNILFNGGAANLITIQTTDDSVRVSGATILQTDVRIDTDRDDADDGTGANVMFTNDAPINSGDGTSVAPLGTTVERNTFTIDAGDTSLLFNEDIGSTQALGSLLIEQADTRVAFGQEDNETAGAGTVGPVNIINADTGIDVGAGTDIIGVDSTDTLINGGGIFLNGGAAGLITLSTLNNDIRFNGVTVLQTAATLQTNAAGGDITFTNESPIDSGDGTDNTAAATTAERNTLTLDAGTGSIFFNEDIGSAQALDELDVLRASGGVTFGVEDTETPFTSGSGPVNIVNADNGIDVGVGNTAANVIEGTGIALNGGTTNDTITLTTIGDDVRFNGELTLQTTNTVITTGSGIAGDIVLTNDTPVDSGDGTIGTPAATTAERNNLTLTVGLGKVEFNEDIGGQQRLNQLTVTKADDGVFFGTADNETPATGGRGPVNIVNADGAIDVGSTDVIDDGVIFNGGAANLITVQTTDDTIRINGPTVLQTNVRIDADLDDADDGTGGDVTFTNDAPIDSGDGTLDAPAATMAERNSLVFDVGGASVLFNEDIGGTQALSTLFIEQADTRVVFGQDDTETPDTGGVGPVNVVNADSGIDIGTGTDIIGVDSTGTVIAGGGIFLNGGSVDLITLTTINSDVRFNGVTTLQTAAVIQSDAAGGDITFTNETPIDSGDGTDNTPAATTAERNKLTLDAGTGSVFFNEDIGATQALDELDILRASGGVTFGVEDTDVPNTSASGPVNIVNADNGIDIGVGNTAANVIQGTGVTFNGGDGALITLTTIAGDVRVNGPLFLHTDTVITTGNNVAGNVDFTNDTPIDSRDGTVGTPAATAAERNDLTITAGLGGVTFNEDIGATQPIGALTVTKADAGVTFGAADTETNLTGGTGPVEVVNTDEDINVGSTDVMDGGIILNGGNSGLITLTTTGDNVRFNGPVEMQTDVVIDTGANVAGDVTFTNDSPIDSQANENIDLTITVGLGGVFFNEDIGVTRPLSKLTVTKADAGVVFGEDDTETPNTGGTGAVELVFVNDGIDIGATDVIDGGIILNGGTVTNAIVMTTAGGSVRLNGPVTLETDTTIDTGENLAGDIITTNDAPVDSQANEFNDFTLRAGLGTVRINENLGETRRLSALTIMQADAGVIFGEADAETPDTGGMGPVDQVNTNEAIDVGSTNIITGGITLNGGTNAALISITTTGDSVRLNGAVTLSTDTSIDTDSTDINGEGGNVLFTNDASINSQATEANDLTLDVGLASIFFNEDIGTLAGGQLGQLIVIEADTSVIFGQAAADDDGMSPLDDAGVVNFVEIVGDGDDGTFDFNIGSADIIGLIALNGGDDNSTTFGAAEDLFTLNTTSDDVRFNGTWRLDSDVRIDTDETADFASGGADILFTNDTPIDSDTSEANSLFMDAGTANIFFNEDIGNIAANTALGRLLVEEADGQIIFGQADTGDDGMNPTVDGGVVNVINIVGDSSNASFDFDLGTVDIIGEIIFNGGDNNSSDVTANANDDLLTLNTTSDDVRINGRTTLNSDVLIDTDETGSTTTGGADVLFTNDTSIDSEVNEGNDLEIDAGIASIFINEDIGGFAANTELGRLLIQEADGLDDSNNPTGGVIFGQAAADDDGMSPTNDGGVVNVVNIIGDTGTGADATFDIDLGNFDIIGRGTDDGNTRNGAGIVLNGGNINSTTFGAVEDTIAFNTTSDDVRFNGHVVLGSDAIIDVDETGDSATGGADVLFTNDAFVDSVANEANSITIDAGTQNVLFNEDIGGGSNQQIGSLIVTEADGSVIFGQATADDDGDMPANDGGVVNVVNFVGDNSDTSFDFDIGHDDIIGLITFNGGDVNSTVDGAAEDLLTLNTTTDDVRINGTLRLDSDVRIDTDETADSSTGGADILFTNDTPIDSDTGEANSLFMDAGIANIFFNEDIGNIAANTELGRMLVEEADGQIIFGQADADDNGMSPTNDGGVVNVINLVGDSSNASFDFDLGTVDIIGEVIFNGGDNNSRDVTANVNDDLLTLNTTSDDVRINGRTTLNSDVLIDTDETESTTTSGADVLFTNDTSIDSDTNEGNDLELDAGIANIFFNEDIGALAADSELGRLLIQEADGLDDSNNPTGGVVFGQAAADDNGMSPLVDGGVVNVVNIVGDTGTGAGATFDIDLGTLDIIGRDTDDGTTRNGAGIVLNGGDNNSTTFGAAEDTIQFNTTSDDVRFNGHVVLASDANIDVDETADSTTGGADVLFTNDAFLDSFANEANSITIDAGTQNVFFNEDIGGGANQQLGALIVEEADGQVIFGQAAADDDGNMPNNDAGVVNVFNIVGDDSDATFDVNLGSADIIGEIILGGGDNNSRDVAGNLNDDQFTLSTTSDDVRINGRLTLNSDVLIDTDETADTTTGGADVLFTNDMPIDSEVGEGNDLELDAGIASVFINEDIGNFAADTELGRLLIQEADGLDDSNNPTGGVIFGQADADDDGMSPLVDGSVVNIVNIIGDIGTGSDATFDIDLGTFDIIGRGADNGNTRNGAGIVLNGGNVNSTTFGAAEDTITFNTTSDDVRFNGHVVLGSDVVIDVDETADSTTGGADVLFTNDAFVDSVSNEANSITIDAGTDNVFFNDDIGGSTNQQIGSLIVSEADNSVIFGQAPADDAGDMPANDGGVVNLVNIVGDSSDTSFDFDIGRDDIIGLITFNGGDVNSTVNGAVEDLFTLNTTTDDVRVNGTLRLDSDARIDTDEDESSSVAGGAGILFTNDAPIDSDTSEANSLFLDAGIANVFFNEDIGNIAGNTELGRLLIEEADSSVVFGQAADDDNGTSPTVDGGVVNVINIVGDSSDTTNDFDIGNEDIIGLIVLNGGDDNSTTFGAAEDLLTLNTTTDDIRFNGTLRLDSDVRIDTDETANSTSGGADILFTNDTPIDSDTSEANSLFMDAGIANIFFNEDIGNIAANTELGRLLVEEADGQIIFGQADTDDNGTSPTVDGGVVNVINIVGDSSNASFDFDLGTVDIIGEIIFNGGGNNSRDVAANANDDLLTLNTTSDDVRVNGRTTLNSDVFIDTDETASTTTGGADVLFTNDTSIDSQNSEGNDLEIDAGIASIFFNEDIGNMADGELGRLLIQEADGLDDSNNPTGGVIFGQAAVDDDGLSPTNDGGVVNVVSIVGDTGTGADATFDIDLGTVDIIGRGSDDGNTRNGAGIVLNGGNSNSTTFGAAEDTIAFDTTSDDVRFNGHVVLGSDTTVDVDETADSATGGADVLFTNDAFVDSVANEANSITIDAGTQNVFFNEDIGGGTNQQIGSLIITEADNSVIFGQAAADDDADMPASDGGVVNVVNIVGDSSDTSFDFDIGRDDIIGLITFNGGDVNSTVDGAAEDLFTLNTTTDDVRVNGTLRLDSDARIDTDEDEASSVAGGAGILFTNDTPIDSDTSEANSLFLDAGIANIFFNEDIGDIAANTELGRLLIEEADTSVVFGQAADDDNGSSPTVDGGVVNVINIVGDSSNTTNDFDIGTEDIIGLIVLNGGDDNSTTFGATEDLLTLNTTTDDVRFNGTLRLDSDVRIDTDETTDSTNGGADILFTNDTPIDSDTSEANSLFVDAGIANIFFNEDIGDIAANTELGRLLVEEADGQIIFGQADTDDDGMSPTVDGGVVNVINIVGDSSNTSFDFDLGTVDIIGEVIFNGGDNNSRDVTANANDDLLTLNTTSDDVRINGRTTLHSDVFIDTDKTATTTTGGADVLFANDTSIDSDTSEGNDLEIDAGIASIFFNEDIGAFAANTELGRLLIQEADGLDDSNNPTGGVIFGQAAADDDGMSPTNDTGGVNVVNIVGDTGTGADATFDIDLGTVDIIGRGADDGNTRNGAGIVLNGGNVNSTTFGAAEDTITFNTTSDDVRFNGHVVLASDATIDVDETTDTATGGADVLFTNDAFIDSVANEANSINIDAGTQNVFFNEDIGGGTNQQIGSLIVTEADNSVIFGQAAVDDDGDMPTNDGGVVNVINIVGDSSDTSFDFDIGSTDVVTLITLNGGDNNSTSGAAEDTITLNTTSDDVRFNGVLRLDSDARIDTDDDDASTAAGGADVLFTNDTSIDSDVSEANSLVMDLGIASVFFNEDIGIGGVKTELGRLIIEEANTSVEFGQADDESGADTGPVNTVNLVGDDNNVGLDIGSETSTGNILLNGGATNLITIQTTDDSVRVSGATILQTDVRIDTDRDDADDGTGANVTFTNDAPIDSGDGTSVAPLGTTAERNTFTIDAGGASVLFNEDIGSTQALGSLLIEQADMRVVFGQEDNETAGAGTVGPVNIVNADTGIDIGTGTDIIGVDSNDALINGGGIFLNGGAANLITLITLNSDIRFNGVTVLQTAATLQTNAAGGDITFTNETPIDSGDGTDNTPAATTAERNTLTLDAGTGSVFFNEDIGSTQALDKLNVLRASGGVTFGVEDIETPFTSGSGPVNIINADNGIDIGVGNTAANVIEGTGIVLNGGTTNDTITLTTIGDDVRFNGELTLQTTNTVITTGANVAGDVVFTKDTPIDSGDGTIGTPAATTAERNNLSLTAGLGKVEFNEDIGAQQFINQLTVTKADDGVFFGTADNETPDTGGRGPVNIVNADGAIDVGSTDVIDDGVIFNGGAANLITVQTTDDTIRINGPAVLQTNVRIDTDLDDADDGTGGDVTFTNDAPIDTGDGTLDAPAATTVERNSLVFDVGGASVLFNEDIGGTQALSTLFVEQADTRVVFGQEDTEAPDTGSVGPVNVVNADSGIDIGTGTDIIGVDSSGTVIAGGGIFLNGGSVDLITLTTINSNVRFNGVTTLQTAAVIQTDAAGGDIAFTNETPIDSGDGTDNTPAATTAERNKLTLDAGTGSVFFNEDIGATQALDELDILRASGGVTFGVEDSDVPNTSASGPVNIVNADNGIDIGVGNTAANVIQGTGVTFNGGDGALITLTTIAGDVRVNGPLFLHTDTVITTGNNIVGNVDFTNDTPIDSRDGTVGTPAATALERNDLTITAGLGSVTFNEDIGATQPIGALTVTKADAGVTFGAADTETNLTGGTGPVEVVNTDEDINIGSTDVIDGGIILNGGASGLITITTTGDNVRFNGPVEMQTDVVIDTGANVAGNVTFTNDSPIDSQANENIDLTITAGLGGVFFNEDIGVTRPLSNLTVTKADAGVVFGEDDTETPDTGGTGAVELVFVNDGIDIGSTDVIDGGIILNGGTVANAIVMTTTGGSVRLNGPVTLETDTTIDTGENLAGDIITTNDAPVDSQAGEFNDFTLRAGLGAVRINENLGETRRLGALTIMKADAGVIFGEADAETPDTGGMGPVDQVNTNEAIDIGSTNIITGGITLNGGTTAALISITSTGDSVRLNGAVTLSTDTSIDTDSTDNNGEGGNVLFTNDASINSQAAEANDLTLDVGVASAFFNEDIGTLAGGQLGQLIVIEADTGVIFGQAAADDDGMSPLNDAGVVNFVEIVGDGDDATFDFDIGSADIIGLIALNGGDDNSTTFGAAEDLLNLNTTTDD